MLHTFIIITSPTHKVSVFQCKTCGKKTLTIAPFETEACKIDAFAKRAVKYLYKKSPFAFNNHRFL